MATVRELMTPSPIKVDMSMGIADCARIMWRLQIRHLPVVDASGSYHGMVSDFDVLQHGDIIGLDEPVWMDRHDARATAGSAARSLALVVKPEDDLLEVMREMVALQREVVAVTDRNGHPVGILTEHDAVRWMRNFLTHDQMVPLEGGPLYEVDIDEPGFAAFESMIDNGVRHVLVTHRGLVVGVLSWRDLVVEDLVSWNAVKVGALLRSPGMHTLPPNSSLREAADLMVRERIGLIPLIDEDGKVHGVVSRTDILNRVPDTAT